MPGPSPPSVQLTDDERRERAGLVRRHASLTSIDDLSARVVAFIDHYDRTAKPFKWTYKGTVLAA